MKILHGNNIELLNTLPDNSIDAVVTDPPYGLGKEPNAELLMQDWIEKGYHEVKGSGFMGKEWDAFVPQPIFWKEVFRVLKPGGHVVSFFGTRTYDWGVMAMRFAGFEVRDCLQWLYGSGFPKSHNISKAIDKMGGESLDWFIDYILKVAVERGVTKKELTMLFPSKNGNATGWLWNKQNNQSITLEQYNTIKDYLKLPFKNIEEAQREVIGKGKAGLTKGNIANFSGEIEFDITAPSTEEAKFWDGWGSALKPANEPIVLARKPLEKGLSIADNVLKWGVGAINIDGCRIETNEKIEQGRNNRSNESVFQKSSLNDLEQEYNTKGRFPANVILTHHNECEDKDCHEDCPIKILDEQSGITKSTPMGNTFRKESVLGKKTNSKKDIYSQGALKTGHSHNDKGGASRFFYVAKVSKSERNKGLEDFEQGQTKGGGGTYNEEAGAKYGSIKAKAQNFHPTVKPIKLMQYLVRLVTPPNGVVLDPFLGSGTTGIACKLEGFDFVGMEQDESYHKIAQGRIENYVDEEQVVNEEENKSKFIQSKLF